MRQKSPEIKRFQDFFFCFSGGFVEAQVRVKLSIFLFDTNVDTNGDAVLVLFVARFLALYISGWWEC
jgi:hypothetical protein